MVRLQTLGQLDLWSADGREIRAVLAQPKRLALLVYLAVGSQPRFCRRDTLLGLFWPELDGEHARGALRKALHFLRKEMGGDVFSRRGAEEVGIRDGAIEVDVTELERAAREGNFERVLELYRGDFLDGFYFDGAPEIEYWIQSERERIRGIAVGAAWDLAEARQAARDYESAQKWAEWAISAQPLSEAALRRLLSFLDKSGDRAAAFAAYHSFTDRLAAEYGITPSDETRELLETLRNRVAALESPRVAPVRTPPTPDVGASAAVGEAPARRRPGAGQIAAAIVIVALLGLGARSFLRTRTPAAATVDVAMRVAVLPFDVRASGDFHYLEDGLVVLLSTRLDGAGHLHTIDPRTVLGMVERNYSTVSMADLPAVARQFGAELYVTGTVAQAGNQLSISAALYRSGIERPLASAQVSGTEGTLLTMVDGVARELLAGYLRGYSGNLSETAAITSGSIAALKAYLRGEELLRAARYADATDAFDAAIAIDSTFALAYYRKSVATAWTGRMIEARLASDQAERLSARLNERGRHVVQALAAARRSEVRNAERLYRTIVERYPDDLEAWFELAELVFHNGPVRGESVSDARPYFEQVLKFAPDHQPALVHLARIAAAEGKTAELDTLTSRVLRIAARGDHSAEMRLFRIALLNDQAAADALIRDHAWEGNSRILDGAWRVAGHTFARAQLRRIIARLDPLMREEWRAGLLLLDAHLAAALGQWHDVERVLDRLSEYAPSAALASLALFATDERAPFDRETIAHIRMLVESADFGSTVHARPNVFVGHMARDTLDPGLRDYYIGALSLRLGEVAAARASAAALSKRKHTIHSRMAAAQLNAMIAARDGRRAQSLEILTAMADTAGSIIASTTPFFPRPLMRRTLAQLFAAQGESEEAARWERSLPEDLGFGTFFGPL